MCLDKYFEAIDLNKKYFELIPQASTMDENFYLLTMLPLLPTFVDILQNPTFLAIKTCDQILSTRYEGFQRAGLKVQDFYEIIGIDKPQRFPPDLVYHPRSHLHIVDQGTGKCLVSDNS